MYSFFAVMMAIAFGMNSAVFSFVMHLMWLVVGVSRGHGRARSKKTNQTSGRLRMHRSDRTHYGEARNSAKHAAVAVTSMTNKAKVFSASAPSRHVVVVLLPLRY